MSVTTASMDPVPPADLESQAQADIATYQGMNDTDRYSFVMDLSPHRRESMFVRLSPGDQRWMGLQGYNADNLLTGLGSTPITMGTAQAGTGTGTAGAAADTGTAQTITPDIIDSFVNKSESEQQTYLDSLSSSDFASLYSGLSESQKSWFDAQGFDTSGSSDSTSSTDDGDSPDSYTTTSQQNAQDLYIDLFGSAETNADDLAYWQQYMNDNGYDATRTAMMNSSNYANAYNDQQQGEDWLIQDPDAYLRGAADTYNPEGIADPTSEAGFYDRYQGQIGPGESGLRTGAGERFAFDGSFIGDLSAGNVTSAGAPAQAAFIEANGNWFDLLQQATEIAQTNMRGELANDVQAQIRTASAEGSMQRGFGLSPAAVNFAARDLGLTSLDLQNLGVQQANTIAQTYEQKRQADLNFVLENARLAEMGREFNAGLAEEGRQFNAGYELDKAGLQLNVAQFDESIRTFNEALLEQNYEYNRTTDTNLLALAQQSRQYNQNLLEMQNQFGTQVAMDVAKTTASIAQFNATFLQGTSQFEQGLQFEWSKYESANEQFNIQTTLAYDTLDLERWGQQADYVVRMNTILASIAESQGSMMTQLSIAGGDAGPIAEMYASLFNIIADQGSTFSSVYPSIGSSVS